jgi:outer membrane protein assembly factor BamB
MTKPFVIVLAMLLAAAPAHAEDWPEWRGPTGQGIASDRLGPTQWSETENVAWKTPLHGKGWSTPVILGDRIWVTTAEETPDTPENIKKRLQSNTGNQPLDLAAEVAFFAVCLDRSTGKILHDIKLFTAKEPQWVHRMNSYASPSPVIEAGRLYCHFGANGTACLDTNDAKVLWVNREHEVLHENGPGSSPVVEGGHVIFHCDGSDKQYVVALDKNTGKTAWKTDRSGQMHSDPQLKKSYGTPLVVEIAGERVLMSPGSNWLYGYDPATGRELFKVDFKTLGFSIVPRPVAAEGLLFLSTSFMQAEMLAVRYDDGPPRIVWREKKSVPKTPSPIVVGEHLYYISDDGGVLSCLDAKTGRVVYRERIEGSHSASPIVAGGKLYFCDRDGVTTVVTPGPVAEVVAKNKLAGSIMASPVAVDGALFLRTEQALYRIEEQLSPTVGTVSR